MVEWREAPSAVERAAGALLGLAVGDALGAPVEFCRRGTFEPVHSLRAGGYFNLPAGAWTDDTAMALCLAESLLEHPDLDPKDLLDRFCRWASKGENSSTGVSVGIGQNTLRVLGNFHRSGTLFAPQTRQKSDGNGAVMRLAPVVVRHWQNPMEARRIAVLQSRTTHFSDLSASACSYLASILCGLISGSDWTHALRAYVDPEWPDDIQKIANENWQLRSVETINATGFVVPTLEAALWSVETTDNFKEALLKAVNLGDDADSVGAVAGQLAGARYGISAIPAAWRSGIAQSERIEELATSLFSRGYDSDRNDAI